MSVRALLGFGLSLIVASCKVGISTRADGWIGVLSVREVAWNPEHVAVGHVRAVADTRDVTVVFADSGATVFSSGAVTAVDGSEKQWVAAATIPGADGSGRWIVGLSRNGRIYRLRGRNSFEDVSARYGLEETPILGLTAFGGDLTGFRLTQEVAIAGNGHVSRYGTTALAQLLGGGGFGLGLSGETHYFFPASSGEVKRYVLPGVRHAALSPDGRLYASTVDNIYATDGNADLSLVYDNRSRGIRDLVASGDNVWFVGGSELGLFDKDHVLETKGMSLTNSTKLAPSSNNDVWAIENGALRRFERAEPGYRSATVWSNSVAVIFARACASCHEPNGVSGTDLSTVEAWESERPAIRRRVVETRTMPPDGHVLSEADRSALETWLRAAP